MSAEQIEKAIEKFMDQYTMYHRGWPNELYYGYCGNGEHSLKPVDIKDLAEFIESEIKTTL